MGGSLGIFTKNGVLSFDEGNRYLAVVNSEELLVVVLLVVTGRLWLGFPWFCRVNLLVGGHPQRTSAIFRGRGYPIADVCRL